MSVRASAMSDAEFDEALRAVYDDVISVACMEDSLAGRGGGNGKRRGKKRKVYDPSVQTTVSIKPSEICEKVLKECRECRQLVLAGVVPVDVSDEMLSKMARFTDKFALKAYQPFLHLVPRLVNVVTVLLPPHFVLTPAHTPMYPPIVFVLQLAEAIPLPGSGVTLPLDLHWIATRCKNSYYAPKRFSAVQLAYAEPRCRVLVFHTGRMVGTGLL